MKKTLKFFLLSIVVLTFGCRDNDAENVEEEQIVLSATKIEFVAESSESQTIKITAKEPWVATITETKASLNDYFEVYPLSGGVGETSMKITPKGTNYTDTDKKFHVSVVSGNDGNAGVKIPIIIYAKKYIFPEICVKIPGTLEQIMKPHNESSLVGLIIYGKLNNYDLLYLGKRIAAASDPTFDLDLSFVEIEGDAIPKRAFYKNNKLINIVLPPTVKFIESEAFYGCEYLVTVTLPPNLRRIESSAFGGCKMLKAGLDLPNSVEYIGSLAFLNCGISGSLTLGKELKEIGPQAFLGNSFMGSLKIPSKVEKIGGNAFEKNKLARVDFEGEYIPSISVNAFNMESLMYVVIKSYFVANTNITVSVNAFSNKTRMQGALIVPDASLPDFETSLPWNTFKLIIQESHFLQQNNIID